MFLGWPFTGPSQHDDGRIPPGLPQGREPRPRLDEDLTEEEVKEEKEGGGGGQEEVGPPQEHDGLLGQDAGRTGDCVAPARELKVFGDVVTVVYAPTILLIHVLFQQFFCVLAIAD